MQVYELFAKVQYTSIVSTEEEAGIFTPFRCNTRLEQGLLASCSDPNQEYHRKKSQMVFLQNSNKAILPLAQANHVKTQQQAYVGNRFPMRHFGPGLA
jgi:hypothetical protein